VSNRQIDKLLTRLIRKSSKTDVGLLPQALRHASMSFLSKVPARYVLLLLLLLLLRCNFPCITHALTLRNAGS
jgi:hypothetical protein